MASAQRSTAAFRALRIGLATLAIVAGADKFAHRIASWEMYLSARVEALLPFEPATLFAATGAAEFAIGAALLTRWGRAAAALLALWLAAVALQVVSTGLFYDVALRDGALAVAAFALARMPEWQDPQWTTRGEPK
jgi:hypothetical protein